MGNKTTSATLGCLVLSMLISSQTLAQDANLASSSNAPTTGSAPIASSAPSTLSASPATRPVTRRNNTLIARIPSLPPAPPNHCSRDAKVLAEHIGLLATLNEISRLRQNSTEPLDVESPGGTRLLFLRQTALEIIVSTGFELHGSMNSVDKEIAEAEEVRAVLAERRDRAIRLNTYADFISGGISGIVGGALNLGEVRQYAPNTIDTAEGAVQTALSAWAFQQQKGEKRLETGVPNLLAVVFDLNAPCPPGFTGSVWDFFNSVPSNNATGTTRRQFLRDHWMQRNLCFSHRGHRITRNDRVKHITGNHPEHSRVTIDVLEDRLAMFADLRAAIAQMDCLLQELTEVVRGKRSLDG